ncbi:MAG: NAD(P)H-dependent oxidoreductase [Gammaproteobacteria bacterium]|jgi:FMN-dependent NADH-azoreductase|nr:NAD(P)H-dependent oxidoreductase [Gammaproteobacteria bacterium]MDH5239345.1 NAD(P)H-dependent oxidoreductase [Gammaproteobacteria bacterium]MDH5259886.1 NAD(P)H-dependent oxidoreductase [Gammaproteobacteria bacterium]MDH5583108.1 NAD(P)H-dependent oxidoreductase [Gammaproteobacteria bacterium]
MSTKPLNILEISASGRHKGSVSRDLSENLVAALEDRYGAVRLKRRDLATGVPFVDEAWIEANFTPDEERSARHRETLAYSDELVNELKEADVLVLGVPVYNFSIPAALKAWIDMVARARLTFRYTENGPRGLLTGKKAYLVVATGGVPVGSAVDFATPYLRHALSFIGITDVEVIAADRLNSDRENSIDRARAQIAELVHLNADAA